MRISFHPARLLAVAALLAAGPLGGPGDVRAQTFAGGTSPTELAEPVLIGEDPALAVAGGDVFIGEGSATLREGRVYIYARGQDGAWEEAGTLTAETPGAGDGFGLALASDGETLLVTGRHGDGEETTVFVFERSPAGEWEGAGRLEAPVEAAGSGFGSTLVVAGTRAFVGAPTANGDRGAVAVFEREDGEWMIHGLLPAEPEAGDRFGAGLSFAEGRLFVGVPGREGDTGEVTVYRMDEATGSWARADGLPLYGVGEGSEFGSRISSEGRRVVVAAPGFGPFGPAAFVYDRDPGDTGWAPSARIVAFDGFPSDEFGRGLALADGHLWVGAPEGVGGDGVAYRYEADEDGWIRAVRIGGTPFEAAEGFGSGIAAEGEVAAIGGPGQPRTGGTVTIFERDASGEWTPARTIRSEGESLVALTGEVRECGDDGRVAQFECANVELLSFLPISDLGGGDGIRLNDVWGWEDEQEGREYALVGRSDGLAFVDITDPSNPVFVGEMLRTQGSPPATWRDMKVYRDHAFVVADASQAHGMQVFDLTRLRIFEGEPITFEPDLTYTEIFSAHNIGLNEDTGFAYIVGANGGGQTCGGGLHMVDVSDPTNPTFAGCFADPQTGRASTGYTHDVQCVIYGGPDERYEGREICFGANETALSVADVTDKDDPIAVSRAAYPNVGYSHQVWLTEDHRYLYMNDELDVISGLVDRTRTIVWDVTELDDPQVVQEYFSPVSASAHNLYIVGDLMYQSNYASGLRIVDISDPENPFEAGYLDTAPFDAPEPGFVGSWSNFPFFRGGTVAVTSIQEGLFLVRYSPDPPVS